MRDQGKTVTTRPAGAITSVPPGPVTEPAAAGSSIRPGDPLLYKIPEVMRMLRMSRSVVFEQLRNGRLRSVRQGRARRIPATAILEYLDLLEREAQEGPGR
jgi:excisionase family DNA binding protein